MLSKEKKIIIACFIQVLIITLIVLFKLVVILTGQDIFLKILPVDPRDPLRGDYLRFRYAITTVDWNQSTEPLVNGDTVYAVLEQDGAYWTVSTLQSTKPTMGEVCLAGKVQSGGLQSLSDPISTQSRRTKLTIVYGIEEYFISEGTGEDFNFRGKNNAAKVSVDKSCNAVLKEVYVNGEPWSSIEH